MRGLNVNGFFIVETLGSGQGGILYLARDASGREAVVRVAREGEDQLSVRIFHEEAVKLLPAIDEVGRATGSDGSRLLLATAPMPPGSGYTQHSVTQRVSPPEPQAAPTNRLLVLAVFLGLLIVAGVGTFLWLSRPRAEPPAPAPIAAPLPAPAPTAAPLLIEPIDAGVVVVQPARPPAPKPAIDCTPDDEWRRRMNLDLADLEAKANAMPALELEAAVVKLHDDVKAARTPAQCQQLEQRFERLVRQSIK